MTRGRERCLLSEVNQWLDSIILHDKFVGAVHTFDAVDHCEMEVDEAESPIFPY